MKKLLVLLVLVALCVFGALNYHFIMVDGGLKVLKKVNLTFDNTFVDARGDKAYRLFLNPALVQAGIKDLLREINITVKK